MNFQEELDRLLSSIEGAQAAILMGYDGIPVAEKQLSSGPAITETVVEYSQLLKEAARIAQGNQLGSLREIILYLDEYTLVFRTLTPTYFAVLLLSNHASVGRSRFLLRKKSSEMESEL